MTRSSIFGIAFFIALAASPAMAYVGPGPGLTMLGSLVGLVGSLFAAIFMILAWPLRLYYKKMKARSGKGAAPVQTPPSDVPPAQ